MPSTFSPSLKIELPSTGSQSGIWGQTANNNIGTLVEQAITGVQSIVMTDANYTLTNYNGVSDEARNAVLVVTGTNAAVRDIIAPLVNKIYTIRNATTGGFGIRIIGVTGTGITIPNGYTTTVYCDSTNFNQSLSAVTGNFNVVGNGLVGGTLGVTGVLSGTTATFSGAISSVSPTFTGVPTAPTASPGTNTTQLATTAFALANGIPSGAIVLWSGSVASIPSGWLLCNGASGTPDLRDRFVIGAGSTYAVGATGGATAVALGTNNLPSHTHNLSASGTTSTVNVDHTHSLSASGTTGTESANHTHPIGGSTGGQSVSHTHGISDPGHAHSFPSALAGGPNSGQIMRGDVLQATAYYGTNTAATGITGTGGASVDHSHTLPANTGTISANHTHNVTVTGTSGAMSANATHSHTVTVTGTSGATGSGTAFSIMPPYFALAYIMKS